MRAASLLAMLALAACGPQGGGETPAGPPTPTPSSTRLSDGPPYPKADPKLAKAYRAWQAKLALPAVDLIPAGAARGTKGGNRIGGPVWLADGERWPMGRKGKPMVFLAQVDFAAMPHLPDYPKSGVLQFFIAHDNMYGADFQRPEKSDFRVIWRPSFATGGRMVHNALHKGAVLGIDSPLEGKRSLVGVALAPKASTRVPTYNDWQFVRDFEALYNRNGWGRLNALLDAHFGEEPEVHHVGGHPEFVQDDWRTFRPEYRKADRVLLNLWSDKTLMWGDAGQGQFLIAREDLLKRDFSNIWYQWDCS